ncbi:hypothetical protein ACTMS2_09540 [Micromonospora sp. SD12]|uniref:hypothetical protein n=1 Tax=Micromonospora sp. SD12 TaxID=3452216 RepID=UPI003F8AF1AF
MPALVSPWPGSAAAADYDQRVRRTGVVRRVNDGASDLVLEVGGGVRPELAVHVAGGGRILLRQSDQVVLLAKVHQDHAGVEYLTTGRFRPLIAPMRSVHAEATADAGGGCRSRRWAHYFASALQAADQSPLYDGRWLLGATATHLEHTPWARSSAHRWATLLLTENPGEIDWFSRQGGWQVLPLRRLSGATDARVKAYRKQARAGILPPVLLWWISGLDCYVILDGHDRILAAVAEEQEPPLIALASVDRHRQETHSQVAVDRYRTEQQLIPPGNVEALAMSSRCLARTLIEIRTDYHPTRAWMLPGGRAAWDATSRAVGPGWCEHLRHSTGYAP